MTVDDTVLKEVLASVPDHACEHAASTLDVEPRIILLDPEEAPESASAG